MRLGSRALLVGDLAGAGARAHEADALTARIGARRFEPQSLLWKAEALMVSGDRHQAAELGGVCDGPAVVETAIGFIGPSILGMIAWTAVEPRARATAIEEAEALLAGGVRRAQPLHLPALRDRDRPGRR